MTKAGKTPVSRRIVVGGTGIAAAALRRKKLEKFGGQTPLGRAGQPAELSSIYVQLAAADASFATGQVYGSAGGSGQP